MRQAHRQTLGLILTALALVVLPGSRARQDSERWTQFTTADGLPCDTVWAIAASPGQGDVWLGTSRGACLYRDGRWYSYTHDHGLGADWVAALAADAQRVYFGTFGGGLTVLEGQTWRTYTAANSGLAGDWISALAVDPRGRLWVGTWGRGLSLLDGGRWQTYDSGNAPLPADHITALAAAPDGTLWVGLHGQGLARLTDSGWTHFAAPQALPDDFVTALAALPDGGVWVGTARGLAHLDAQGRPLATYTAQDGLPHDHVQALAIDPQGRLWVGTSGGAALRDSDRWTAYRGHQTLTHDYVSALAASPGGVWFGSLSAGVARLGAGTPAAPRRLPVVLVHGWHGPQSDRLEDSEFRFLATWLREDGYPVYYAQGIHPQNTLHENAAHLRAAIEQARQECGAAQVDVIAFSMGGLNTRAYVESALYAGDVAQAFILGTPQAGVRTWYPFLLREAHEWSRDPSTFELTPEYAQLFNTLHRPSALVPYTLIAGDARGEDLPETLRGLPPGDALISAGSALALDGPALRKIVTADLHAWSDETVLLGLTSFLWPRRTYDAHIRNRLRLGPQASLPGVAEPQAATFALPEPPGHSPFYSGELRPGETVTATVPIDAAGEARFYLRSQGGELTFHLVDPQGHRLDSDSIGERGEYFSLGLADFQSYLVRSAQPGPWQVVVGRPQGAQAALRFTGYALTASSLSLTVGTGGTFHPEDQPVVITASLRQGELPVPRARLEAEIGRPDGDVDRLVLLDDGEHQDGQPHDGVYGATYRPPGAGGYYTLFVTVQGDGFARTAERVFAVSPGTARLAGTYAEAGVDADRDGRFDSLALQVGVEVRASGDYLVAATLLDRQGGELARVVQPLALSVGLQTVTLHFPGRALAEAAVDGPYTVGRVLLLDETGAAIPLQEATRVLQTRPYRHQDYEGP